MLGLERGAITAGTVRFDGADIKNQAPHALVRSGLFHVMEGRRIFPDLTVDENLIAATYALEGRDKVEADFESVFDYFPRLRERRTGVAGYLSGGEQQMLALGRGLIARPKLILMDEPSLGLSPVLVEEIFRIIGRINKERGVSILLVEQNAAMALSVASYGYIMEQGKIVIDGTVEKLTGDRDVREFYLGAGVGAGGFKSFRDVKHYKRRKRWLS
jgi:branched-chain amino acid transport system ATP-binding protein